MVEKIFIKNRQEEDISAMLKDKKQRQAAFSAVVKTYQEPLYWHIRKMVLVHDDANDVLQNVFLKAWSAIDNFRGEAKISTWLFRIAVNETLTFLNAERAKQFSSALDLEDVLLQNLKSDSFFDGDALQLKLQEAILTLPEKQRMVFNMKYFDDMKYEDMEKIFGTTVGALKASYHHAVKKIENYLLNDEISIGDEAY